MDMNTDFEVEYKEQEYSSNGDQIMNNKRH